MVETAFSSYHLSNKISNDKNTVTYKTNKKGAYPLPILLMKMLYSDYSLIQDRATVPCPACAPIVELIGPIITSKS